MVRDAAAALDTAFAALAFTALAFTAWYAIAIGLVALTAVLARTPERRRDARQVLTILLRKTPR